MIQYWRIEIILVVLRPECLRLSIQDYTREFEKEIITQAI